MNFMRKLLDESILPSVGVDEVEEVFSFIAYLLAFSCHGV
jgi:hypothetical protein